MLRVANTHCYVYPQSTVPVFSNMRCTSVHYIVDNSGCTKAVPRTKQEHFGAGAKVFIPGTIKTHFLPFPLHAALKV